MHCIAGTRVSLHTSVFAEAAVREIGHSTDFVALAKWCIRYAIELLWDGGRAPSFVIGRHFRDSKGPRHRNKMQVYSLSPLLLFCCFEVPLQKSVHIWVGPRRIDTLMCLRLSGTAEVIVALTKFAGKSCKIGSRTGRLGVLHRA